MEVVNAVYRGELEGTVNLRNIHENLPNSVLHTNRSSMLVLKDVDTTLIFC